MYKFFKKPDLVYLLSSFLIPFYIYCYTLCPTVSVYADAGEYPTLAYVSGFAHPPGYPLFILIIKLFQRLPFGNPALKANLVAAFFGALTIPIFYLLTKRLTKNSVAAFIAGLTLAFSKMYWRNSVVSEVFTLLAFFIVLTFYLFLLWQETGQKKYFYWFLVACGFGLAHHQTLIFTLLPLLIWFALNKGWRKLNLKDYLLAIPLLAIGFLPYLNVYLSAKNLPLMNWENPENLKSLFRLFTRATYGSFQLTVSPEKINSTRQALDIGRLFLGSFWLGIVFVPIGIINSFRQNKKVLLTCLLIICTIIVIFGFFSGIPLFDQSQVNITERFLIIAGIYLAILIAAGLTALKIPRYLWLILPITAIGLNFNQVNQRGNYFGQYLAQDLLTPIPANSIFIFSDDAAINALFYYRYVMGERPDVELIVGSMFNLPPDWYSREIKYFYPDIVLPEKENNPQQYLADFMSLNFTHKNIYFYPPNIGQDSGLYFPQKPRGLVAQYNPHQIPLDAAEEEQNLKWLQGFRNLSPIKKYPTDFREHSLLFSYADAYLSLARLNSTRPEKAARYYQEAQKILPEVVQYEQKQP